MASCLTGEEQQRCSLKATWQLAHPYVLAPGYRERSITDIYWRVLRLKKA